MLANKRPPRPEQPAIKYGLDDAMWKLINDCWNAIPDERPNMKAIIERLKPGYPWQNEMEEKVDMHDSFLLSVSAMPGPQSIDFREE